MATAQTLDPRIFKTWEDAFQHPIPIVRKLEQQLRTNIDETRQKLRSLVGASYRDLLETAERIIEMDEQIQTTENYLGGIGRKCNADAVANVSGNYEKMRKSKDELGREKAGIIAQTKVLHNALTVASRMIKNGGDALSAAKLWVLARLLGKSISESKDQPAVLEDCRRKVVMLRKSLLSYIDRTVVKTGSDKAALANALCAYALVTNSTPKDVLRHFLQTRYEQLNSKVEVPSEAEVLQMLELFSQTLSDTRSLFPKLFTDGMAQLENTPLLRDQQVSNLSALNLDVYGIWIAEGIRAFTPWVRHDQLTTSEVGEGLGAWAKQAQQSLLQAVQGCVGDESDAVVVLGIRKSVLSRYITLGSKLPSNTHLQGIHELRKAFLDRLIMLAGTTAANIELDLSERQQGEASSEQRGWDLATRDFDLRNGALSFRSSLLRERHGRDEFIQHICKKLDRWVRALDGVWVVADQMRSTRWEDDLDFELDDLSDGELRTVLSKQDPDQLQTSLRGATATSLRVLYLKVEQSVAASLLPSTTLIRVHREIDQRRRKLADRTDGPERELHTAKTLSELHSQLAETVIELPVQQYSISLQTKSRTPTELWDGTPPLPVQPTPKTYRFLVSLHRAMSNAGNDLWSYEAVSVLKSTISRDLVEVVKKLSASDEASAEVEATNDHSKDSASAENNVAADTEAARVARNDETSTRQVQMLFDVLYLQSLLSSAANSNGFESVIENIKQRAAVDETGYERMRKSANEYRKRTCLLFGLLAAHSRT